MAEIPATITVTVEAEDEGGLRLRGMETVRWFHGSPDGSYAASLSTHCGKARRAAEVILDMLVPDDGGAPAERVARGRALIGL